MSRVDGDWRVMIRMCLRNGAIVVDGTEWARYVWATYLLQTGDRVEETEALREDMAAYIATLDGDGDSENGV